MGDIVHKFQNFVDLLNRGCDPSTNNYISDSYIKLTTISAIYPVLDRDRPLLCLLDFLILLLVTGILSFALYLLSISDLELMKISFVLLAHEVHIQFLILMSLVMVFHSWMKRPSTCRLHRIISENFFDYQEDLSATMGGLLEDKKREKLGYIIWVFLIGFATSVAAIATPILNRVAGTFDFNSTDIVNFYLPVPTVSPGEDTNLTGWTFLFIYEMLIAFCIAMCLSVKSFMIIETTLHVKMQLLLLIRQFETIELRAVEMFLKVSTDGADVGKYSKPSCHKSPLYKNKLFNKCFKTCLRKNIQHHQAIISATNEVNDIFSFYVFVFYLTATVVIAVSILSTSESKEFPGTTVGAIIICIVEIGFVAMFSHLGQSLTDLSRDLRDRIYSIPWYYSDESVKRTVRILQLMTLKPITFSFYNLLEINHDSFSAVLNSAYSYYSLVKASR